MAHFCKIIATTPVLLSLGACLGSGSGNNSDAVSFAQAATHAAPVMNASFVPSVAGATSSWLIVDIDGTTHEVNSIKIMSNTTDQVIFSDPPVGSIGNFNVYRQPVPLSGFTDEVALIMSSEEHNLDFGVYGLWAESDNIDSLLSTGSTTVTGLLTGASYTVDTTPTDLPASGTASYSGAVIAAETDSSGTAPISTLYTGDANVLLDFAGGSMSSTMTLVSANRSTTKSFLGSGSLTDGNGSGTSRFFGALSQTGGNLEGFISGHIAGPGQEEVLSVFRVDDGADLLLRGSFGATRVTP